ncbi:MAG TPA: ABC transporter substrate-binding protein [Acetobacteraceae bacterium]|jgi:polar amino acid transport system substrate-binding protein|nr:ABC transporter substrate-binding protein [Acetobacteraceae bacterium]
MLRSHHGRRAVLAMATAAAGAALLPRDAFAAGPTITAKDDSFKRVQAAKTLAFGTSNDQPYAFMDDKTHQVIGIDAEMLLAMLEKLGIPGHSVKQIDFEGLIPALLAGRMDMIADAMYITDKRKKVIDFSDGWYQYGEALLVKKGNPLKLHSMADLKGHTAGSQLGTVYLDWLNAVPGVTVKSYSTMATMMQDMTIGRLDAGIIDAPVAGYALTKNPAYAAAFEMVADYKPKEIGVIGSGFRKDEGSLREAINWALAQIKADGTDLKILKKWGLGENNRHLGA